MRTLLLAGTSLLALSASIATASATPVPFSDSTVGSMTFTAPSAGLYDILAFGAQGGSGSVGAGDLGAEIGGDFMLSQGEVLSIAVGGVGLFGTLAGGGGGGSFVVVQGTAAPLVISGGGGGSALFGGSGGQAGPAGGSGGGGAGGTGGNGGAADPVGFGGGSGGGFQGAGGSGSGSGNGGGRGGGGYPGLLGGSSSSNSGGSGGFGGGGAGGPSSGGGGGGYSGGGGGANGSGGGGGGSFDGGLMNADFVQLANVHSGDGSVTITELSPATAVPEPASLALLGAGLLGSLVLHRRRTR